MPGSFRPAAGKHPFTNLRIFFSQSPSNKVLSDLSPIYPSESPKLRILQSFWFFEAFDRDSPCVTCFNRDISAAIEAKNEI